MFSHSWWFMFFLFSCRGRLLHGRHFTYKSINGDTAITFVSTGVEGAFATEEHPYAAHGPWLQVTDITLTFFKFSAVLYVWLTFDPLYLDFTYWGICGADANWDSGFELPWSKIFTLSSKWFVFHSLMHINISVFVLLKILNECFLLDLFYQSKLPKEYSWPDKKLKISVLPDVVFDSPLQ